MASAAAYSSLRHACSSDPSFHPDTNSYKRTDDEAEDVSTEADDIYLSATSEYVPHSSNCIFASDYSRANGLDASPTAKGRMRSLPSLSTPCHACRLQSYNNLQNHQARKGILKRHLRSLWSSLKPNMYSCPSFSRKEERDVGNYAGFYEREREHGRNASNSTIISSTATASTNPDMFSEASSRKASTATSVSIPSTVNSDTTSPKSKSFFRSSFSKLKTDPDEKAAREEEKRRKRMEMMRDDYCPVGMPSAETFRAGENGLVDWRVVMATCAVW